MGKYVHMFSTLERDPAVLGGKGYGLVDMTALGLPVPPGFVISTQASKDYLAAGNVIPDGLWVEVDEALSSLQGETGRILGDEQDPLLLSARSGAPVSMPGMMDTVLDIGMTPDIAVSLSIITCRKFAYDNMRRLTQMFGTVILGLPESVLDMPAKAYLLAHDNGGLTGNETVELSNRLLDVYKKYTGVPFPDDTLMQLRLAIEAVFRSWNSARAIAYRKEMGISDDIGTAVVIQTMVFGNMGENCATGVMMTRDPTTGENVLSGDYLLNAQGEDVVNGMFVTSPLSDLREEAIGDVYAELAAIAAKMERERREMLDIEWTVEQGKLWVLQVRTGKRTAAAEVRIAVEMVEEDMISKTTAIRRVGVDKFSRLLHPKFGPMSIAGSHLLAEGIPITPGAVCGFVAMSADAAVKMTKEGKKVILMRPETVPDDIHGMIAAIGIITGTGGSTSHAALVARELGKVCVVGVQSSGIDEIEEGDIISLDGTSGCVYKGAVDVIPADMNNKWLLKMLQWADEYVTFNINAHANSPANTKLSFGYGANTVLYKTGQDIMEQQMEGDVLDIVVPTGLPDYAMDTMENNMFSFLRQEMVLLFAQADNAPLSIQLLDIPITTISARLSNWKLTQSNMRVDMLMANNITHALSFHRAQKYVKKAGEHNVAEQNPSFGMRGTRMMIARPRLLRAQLKAIFSASDSLDYNGDLSIVLPRVTDAEEVLVIRDTMEKLGLREHAKLGVVIDTPRACMEAGALASVDGVEFIIIDTDRITECIYGMSKLDATNWMMDYYIREGVFEDNPYEVLDEVAVLPFIEMVMDNTTGVRRGISGSHASRPELLHKLSGMGFDFVVLPAADIPMARMAIADHEMKQEVSS